MFAPSSSDDDGASRDVDLGSHLQTLTRLACQAQTLVADLLLAADAQHVTFDLDRHPERADALFDFEYLRHPAACEARLSASPALRRVDAACRAGCRSRVWRAYRSFADVVRWHASFVAFCESLREGDVVGDSSSEDAGFLDRSHDSDTRYDVMDSEDDTELVSAHQPPFAKPEAPGSPRASPGAAPSSQAQNRSSARATSAGLAAPRKTTHPWRSRSRRHPSTSPAPRGATWTARAAA